MVTLSKIYTRTGDKGTTGLGDGERRAKDDPRIEAYGTVDELNAALGLMVLNLGNSETTALLTSLQNDLFDLGADLCVPEDTSRRSSALRVTEAQVKKLEEHIDQMNKDLPPLNSFILPGGGVGGSWAHLARTIARRAERRISTLAKTDSINPHALAYINRLSDFLFVLSRHLNRLEETPEPLWVPGLHNQPSDN